jgi:hypothetical protein
MVLTGDQMELARFVHACTVVPIPLDPVIVKPKPFVRTPKLELLVRTGGSQPVVPGK